MTTWTEIPVVDMTPYRIDAVSDDEVDSENVRSVADSLCRAFRDIGFCYVKNHGFQQSLIDKMFAVSKTFFEKPDEYKNKYPHEKQHGWIGREAERPNPERPGDYKEALNFPKVWDKDHKDFPMEDLDFPMEDFSASCFKLSLRILDLMSIGLGLEDRKFLRKCHTFEKKGNSSILRTVMYPALPPGEVLKLNQIRCGEHSDYGSLTLVFQDDVGGLEVKSHGEYIPATPIPGTILLIIGDLMQRWTADKLMATKHRVVIPEEEAKKRISRQSIIFFILPDDETMIESLDKSNKYEPVQTSQYLLEQLAAIY